MSNAVLIPDGVKGFVSRDEVLAQDAPERTRTWNPIPHRTLLGWVEGSLYAGNWTIKSEQHTLAHNGETWFAVFTIAAQIAGGDPNGNDAVHLACGIRNDTGKRLSGSFLAGKNVFICANLDFSTELLALSKHTSRIHHRLPRMIDNVVGQLEGYCGQQRDNIAQMRHKILTVPESNDQLVKMVEGGVIPQTELLKVKKVYDRDDRWGEDPTVWRLHNATTTILQRRLQTNAPDFSARTVRLNSMMDRLAWN